MPVHDWARVEPGLLHDFHISWIVHLSDGLNGGLLPSGYYAIVEQHSGKALADVITLPIGDEVRHKALGNPIATYRHLRRSLAIRLESNHRLVALLEILSPANKDRPSSVQEFVDKAHEALRLGCHLLVVDLFPPGAHDPGGMHEAIWEWFRDLADAVEPFAKPLLLAAYSAGRLPEAHLEPVALGDRLPDMPLFLDPLHYINVPLEETYQAAYRGLPVYWRGVLEGRETHP